MIHGLGSTHRAFLFRGYFAILYHMNDIIPLEGFFARHHELIEDNQVHLSGPSQKARTEYMNASPTPSWSAQVS